MTIPNGFDPADFDVPAAEKVPGEFRIVHAGYVHPTGPGRASRVLRDMLGGAVQGLDIETRSHVYLVRAVERLLAEDPKLSERLRVHLVGVIPPGEESALPPFVLPHGYLAHVETVAMLRSADLLFLPMHDLPAGRRARIVPGKTYEYLAAGCPILAAVPDGDARDLLERAGNAIVCRPSEVGCLAAGIRAELERRARGDLPASPRPDVIAPYERRALAARLAQVFEAVLSPASGERPPSA